MRSSAATSSSATAVALTQLRSAGTTYHGACSRRGLRDHLVVGGDVVVEPRAHVEIVLAELPPLLGVVEPLLQPLALLVLRDVEEHLDDRRALVDEHPLPGDDVPGAALPHLLRRKLEHPHGDDVLVVGAVEDADLAAGREHGVDAPEVVVRELGRGRRLERGDRAALRVDALEDAPDDAVLAGGVEPLEHEQDASACPRRRGVAGAARACACSASRRATRVSLSSRPRWSLRVALREAAASSPVRPGCCRAWPRFYAALCHRLARHGGSWVVLISGRSSTPRREARRRTTSWSARAT